MVKPATRCERISRSSSSRPTRRPSRCPSTVAGVDQGTQGQAGRQGEGRAVVLTVDEDAADAAAAGPECRRLQRGKRQAGGADVDEADAPRVAGDRGRCDRLDRRRRQARRQEREQGSGQLKSRGPAGTAGSRAGQRRAGIDGSRRHGPGRVVDITAGRPSNRSAAGRCLRRPLPAVTRASSASTCHRCPVSGPGGRISVDDVKTHARNVIGGAACGARRVRRHRRCRTSRSGVRSSASRCAPFAARRPSA